MGKKYTYTSGGKPVPRDNSSDLPLTVEKYLQNGASEGERNNTLFSVAAQCRDIDMPLGEAENLLLSTAMAGGLSESESLSAIRSAYQGAKREAPKGAGGNSSTKAFQDSINRAKRVVDTWREGSRDEGDITARQQVSKENAAIRNAQPAKLPEPFEAGFEAILLSAFEEGEGVCVGGTFENADGEFKPDKGVTLPREKWLERIRDCGGVFSKMHSSKEGHYLRVNPMRIDPKSKNTNDDVTSFRHCLVEFDSDKDGKDIPKEKQMGAFLASGLPISAILDSGNKSLHAWVRVDAEDKAQYEERAAQVYALFECDEFDSQNHNPNRYSRCPDGLRLLVDGPRKGELSVQRLLKVNAGADNWEEWERQNSIRDFGEEFTIDQLLEYDYKNDPNNVLGNRMMCKGGTMVVVSQSGVGKSSLQRQLEAGLALERTDMTFGIKPVRALRQLLIQAENDVGDMSEVVCGVRDAFNLSKSEAQQWQSLCRTRRITEYAGEEFMRKLEVLVLDLRPDIVWIDPLNNFIGDDISKAEVVSQFCVQGLNTIANRCGTVFILIHHMGKPKDDKYMTNATGSDMAYLGLGSSVLTNTAREVLVMARVQTPNESDPKTFRFVATKRGRRAGMKTMPVDGDPTEIHSTDEIYIQHSNDGRIYWKQCPKPEAPSDRKGGRPAEAQQADQAHRAPGRPSSLSPKQMREILQTAEELGGKLCPRARSILADKFGKSPKTIGRFLSKLEERAALAGRGVTPGKQLEREILEAEKAKEAEGDKGVE